MSKSRGSAPLNAASIAGSVLDAFQFGQAADRTEALARAGVQVHQLTDPDSGEAERMDVLRGALEALAGSRREQVQAGIWLLQHLASGTALAMSQAV